MMIIVNRSDRGDKRAGTLIGLAYGCSILNTKALNYLINLRNLCNEQTFCQAGLEHSRPALPQMLLTAEQPVRPRNRAHF